MKSGNSGNKRFDKWAYGIVASRPGLVGDGDFTPEYAGWIASFNAQLTDVLKLVRLLR
jgi:hypothetical protein